jgi:hypothetical protein
VLEAGGLDEPTLESLREIYERLGDQSRLTETLDRLAAVTAPPVVEPTPPAPAAPPPAPRPTLPATPPSPPRAAPAAPPSTTHVSAVDALVVARSQTERRDARAESGRRRDAGDGRRPRRLDGRRPRTTRQAS